MKSTNILYLSFGLLMALCPLLLNSYWTDVFNNVGLYTILALSLNVILGHAGLFHMGHAAFYAIGAYTAAILNTMFGIFGTPNTWTEPLCIKVIERRSRRGFKFFSIEPVDEAK